MKKMEIKDCFDKDGNFINPFDPYRCDDNDPLYLAYIFNTSCIPFTI